MNMNIKFIRLSLLITMLFLSMSLSLLAQSETIKGVVRDVGNQPLIGVNVVQKGTANGTITDFNGNYTIKMNRGDTIVFTYIGFISKEIQVGGSDVLNVILQEDSEVLDDLVVVGYGTQSRHISVYNVDSDMDRAWYIFNLDKLYALTTNYPKALLNEINIKEKNKYKYETNKK